MRPVLFRVRGREVPSYPALLFAGLVAGLVAGNVAAHALGLDAARWYAASVVLLVPALAGARLASAIANREVFGRGSGLLWRRSVGGQAMYGGLVAVPLSIPLLTLLRLPSWAFWDAATFTMLTGMVFARLGCLLNGCCAGRRTDGRFGLVLADARGVRLRRVPVQLLEAGAGAAILAGAAVAAASRPAPGVVFAGSLAAYAAARLFLQPLRERQRRAAGLPTLAAVSGALLVAAVGVIGVRAL